jgi:hypothetical protein
LHNEQRSWRASIALGVQVSTGVPVSKLRSLARRGWVIIIKLPN